MTVLTHSPVLLDLAAAVQHARELQAQPVSCQQAWALFARMLEAFNLLAADEAMEVLDQLAGDAHLQPIALGLARRATERFPEQAHGWFHLGRNLLVGNAESADAHPALERAWELSPPSRAEFAVCFSAACLAARQWSEAERICRQRLEWQPACADAYSNLSIALRRQYQPEAAVEAARQALALEPGHEHAPSNLVLALVDCCRFPEALQTAREFLARRPTDDRLRLPMAELELRLGDWQAGWADMDARFAAIPQLGAQQEARERLLGVPRWRGESLAGKTLGIWLEQGYGDAILLVRFLPRFAQVVREQGGKLVFGCFGPLEKLFRPLIPEDVELNVDHLRATDYHLPLMSACADFGITEADVSGSPYLKASPQGVSKWRRRLKRDPRLHIALAWTGNPQQVRNDVRSLGRSSLLELLAQEGVLFHSVNPDMAELVSELAASGLPIVDQSASLGSFADTAELLKAVDAVVSTCTSTAHLAAALGAPTLLLLDKVGSYLWRCDTQRSPWYDSVRILRQNQLGDWSPVIQQLRRHLVSQVDAKHRHRS
ncbi:tetratricopeptide repeat protein [Pseudomonas nicosulfuronedens]|uniref:Tetratricopeptide repeat protein n=1 Tax=Pseudomonas nicosulfuronedens TaxID=2571105 RepID=A0A5R9QQX4_9PSED|nr:tetratricopeptide repeat protein [Pseudomonas nicosulfuronedens]MDH1013069.1 tetratricopeptide repeat protein [Pseudomonas nicosulfuronedens]MDH1983234.1 tetratricopeptide repeat protein [Pseudomonas nicosulfuronedens]MDH2030862.1 tetratricopeptide repeat protein [Pseudomonas nicosulfuronedens]TLX72226.1 tetratricopeptide repeat protein [Pseudomonas nicosulfuronedens]